MENKSLDGIKKLNKDEVEKSRKIVLDYIGSAGKNSKAEDEIKAESPVRAPARRPVESAGQSVSHPQDEPALPEQPPQEVNISQPLNRKGPREMDGISAKKEKEADKPKNISPKSGVGLFRRMFKKKTASKEKVKPVKKAPPTSVGKHLIGSVKNSKPLAAEGFFTRVFTHHVRDKDSSEVKGSSPKNKRKKKEPPKKIEKKKRLKPKRRIGCGNFIKIHKARIKLFAYFAALAVILLAIFYIVFALSLLNFNFDTKLSRQITKYIPVPAMISKIGFVNYYDYKDFSNKEKEEAGSGYNLIYIIMMRALILEDLAAQYNIPVSPGESLHNYNEIAAKLSGKVILDREINKVALSRINKIKQLIDAGQDFTQIGERYSDKLSVEDYIAKNEAVKKFGSSVESLSSGQVSPVISTEEGFYIIRLASRNDYSYKLQHIFIKARTLEDYLTDELGKLKAWSLVD